MILQPKELDFHFLLIPIIPKHIKCESTITQIQCILYGHNLGNSVILQDHGTVCKFTYLSRANRLASQDEIFDLLTIIRLIGPVGFTCIISDVIRLKQWFYQGLKSKSLHLLSSWTSKKSLMQATLATNNAPPLDSISSAILYFARTSWYSVFTYLSGCMLSSDLLTLIRSIGPGGFTYIVWISLVGYYSCLN